jgi:hypothetical protein
MKEIVYKAIFRVLVFFTETLLCLQSFSSRNALRGQYREKICFQSGQN